MHNIRDINIDTYCTFAQLQEVANDLLKCFSLPCLFAFLQWPWLVVFASFFHCPRFTWGLNLTDTDLSNIFFSFLGVPSINCDPTEQMFEKRTISPRGFECEIVPPLLVSFWVTGKQSELFYKHGFAAVKDQRRVKVGAFPSERLKSAVKYKNVSGQSG